MLTVLQISHGIYPYSQAGTEIYTAELATALIAQGIDVTVVVPASAKIRQAGKSGLPTFVQPIELASPSRFGNKLRYTTFRGPLWKQGMRDLIESSQPNVIHVQHAAGFGLSLLNVLAESRLPLVVTLPDFWLLCPSSLRRCGGKLLQCARDCCQDVRGARWLGLAATPYILARRCRVAKFITHARPLLVAISDATKRVFLQEGVPAELLITQTWGIKLVKAPALQTNGSIRIGFLGSMRSHKGCHVLLEAFKRLPNGNSLHFHGSGDEKYIETLRMQSNGASVSFHGRFDHRDVGTILADIDIVVVPSLWEETYCLVAQEAMAARRPVIVTSVGGMADRIIDGINGFVVPPDDSEALARKIQDVASRLPEIKATLNYDLALKGIDEDARQWVEIYKRAISNHERN